MTEQDVKDILEQILELGSILGWETVIVQNSEGQILGLYMGSKDYVEDKKKKHAIIH